VHSDCRTAPQHIKPYSLMSTSHSVVFPIPPGVVGLVAHVAYGSTKSETTPAIHLPTSGNRPLDAVIMDERRDGPRWLCNDDDDSAIFIQGYVVPRFSLVPVVIALFPVAIAYTHRHRLSSFTSNIIAFGNQTSARKKTQKTHIGS